MASSPPSAGRLGHGGAVDSAGCSELRSRVEKGGKMLEASGHECTFETFS